MSQDTIGRPEVDDLYQKLQAVATIDIDSQLIRSEELGRATSFETYRPVFTDALAYAQQLASLDWSTVTPGIIQSTANTAENLRAALESVITFKLEDQTASPVQVRDRLGQRVEETLRTLREQTMPIVGYLSWQKADLEGLARQIDRMVANSTERVEALVNELEARQQDAQQILEAIREAAASAGVAGESLVFKKAADEHQDASWKWLAAAIVTAAATIATALGLVLLWDIHGEISEASNLQLVLAKGTILLVGFFVTTNLLRVFRSQAHLAVVNRHREHALSTFRTFVEGTENSEIKDKVLLEATHAIFGHVPSGLIEDRGSDLEILDSVAGSVIRRG